MRADQAGSSYESQAEYLQLLTFLLLLVAGVSTAFCSTDAPETQKGPSICKVPSYLSRTLNTQVEWPLPILDNRGQSKTPPMGFSFWNAFGDNPGPSDQLTRQTADALVATGLRDAGYKYFLAFDGVWWSAAVDPPRDSEGHPRIDEARWPNGIQSVSDYIHKRGLKVGGYTDIGKLGYCVPAEIGVLGHEQQDADQFAQWGWDYIKVDDHGPGNFYTIAKSLLNNSSHRPIVLSLSTPLTFPYEFAPRIANLWRVGRDVTERLGTARWTDILREFDLAGQYWWAQAPGRWNDLDMLLIGLYGISEEETKSHFSMWAIRGSPLLIGADIRNPHQSAAGPIPRVTPRDLEILKNSEVIAVDQDPLGASGKVVSRSRDGSTEVDAKPLASFASGQYAVLLLNRSDKPQPITVSWKSLGLLSTPATVRDLWAHADLGPNKGQFTAPTVPPHGVQMLRIEGAVDWSVPREYEAESSYNQLFGSARIHCLPSREWKMQLSLKGTTDERFLAMNKAVVEGIGAGEENRLQFNEVWADKEGQYRLEIRYSASTSTRARITANNWPPFWLSFKASRAGMSFDTLQSQVRLQAGKNTIVIDNPEGPAPSIDKLIISPDTSKLHLRSKN